MRVSELLSKMWYQTRIILVGESTNYKGLHSVTQYKKICDWWGTVSDFVNVDCPNRPDKVVKVVKKAAENDHNEYKRWEPCLALLKGFPGKKWGNLVVLHYGY